MKQTRTKGKLIPLTSMHYLQKSPNSLNLFYKQMLRGQKKLPNHISELKVEDEI